MNYAHGLVDKNNIIRTVEDIMCSANDSSHETITDFKQSVESKLDNVYSKNETLDHIKSAIRDFQNDVLKKSYITRATTQDRIDTAITDLQNDVLEEYYATIEYVDDYYTTIEYVDDKISEVEDKIETTSDSTYTYLALNTIPAQIENAIDDLMDNQIPDQYYNKSEVDSTIEHKLNEYDSYITINYATKTFVNTTKNDILSECEQSFYTKDHIKDNYYTITDHNTDITALTNRILQLEQRIAALESK